MLLIAVWQEQSVPAKGAGTDAIYRLDKQEYGISSERVKGTPDPGVNTSMSQGRPHNRVALTSCETGGRLAQHEVLRGLDRQ